MTAQHPHMDRRAARTKHTHTRDGGRERKRMHAPTQERLKFPCVHVA